MALLIRKLLSLESRPAVIPFFTAVITEKICRSIYDMGNDSSTLVKLIIVILTGLALIGVEILGAGVVAEKINQKLFHSGNTSVRSKVLSSYFLRSLASPSLAFTSADFALILDKLCFTSSMALTSYPSSASGTAYRPVPAPISNILISEYDIWLIAELKSVKKVILIMVGELLVAWLIASLIGIWGVLL